MKTYPVIKIIDLLSFIFFTAMLSTGALLEFTLPMRSGPLSIWGLTRHEWGTIHSSLSLIFLLLMCSHLIVHFKFIKQAITGGASREHKYRIAVGFIALFILLSLAIAPVISPKSNSTGGRGEHRINR